MADLYVCADCGDTSRHQALFYAHVARYHPERIGTAPARGFTCSRCGAHQDTVRDLRAHLAARHPDYLETMED